MQLNLKYEWEPHVEPRAYLKKLVKVMFYFFLCVFYTYSQSHFRLSTFHMLNSHMWLIALLLIVPV